MAITQYENLIESCRELFGPEIEASSDFLQYLQPGGIKSAFRRRAKETHPDMSGGNAGGAHDIHSEFCRARTAYETLCRFLSQRDVSAPATPLRQTTSWHRPAARQKSGSYHHGDMPQCILQLGRYLYYRRMISFQDLLHALSWQRSTRKPLGAIAREWGWMTASDVAAVISADLPAMFGEKAMRLGIIDTSRLRLLLTEQKLRHRRLGEFFVERRLLTPKELETTLRELKIHNGRVAGRK